LARARHRLDLLLLPTAPERGLDDRAWRSLVQDWSARGIVRDESPGRRASDLIIGGFQRLWLDQPGGLHLFANHQGGYRVYCRDCQALVTGAFVSAVGRWRAGGRRELECPSCGHVASLEGLVYRPEAAYATWAVVLSSVTSLELEPELWLEINRALGPLRSIFRRVG
jgi:hypothetical protein